MGNNKKDLKEIELGGRGGWIHIPQDRDKQWCVVNTVVNLWVPSTVENCWT